MENSTRNAILCSKKIFNRSLFFNITNRLFFVNGDSYYQKDNFEGTRPVSISINHDGKVIAYADDDTISFYSRDELEDSFGQERIIYY